MDKPKCKICGERHYGLCKKAAEPGEAPRAPLPSKAQVGGRAEETKAPFDRTKYQREYMKSYIPKWRAAKRVKKPK